MTAAGVLLAGWDGLGVQDHQRDMYAPAFSQHPEFRIAGVVGIDERAASAAARLDAPLLSDVASAVRETGASVVSVCLAGVARREAIMAALDAGAHVLVDRPLADTAAGAVELAREAERTGRQCIPAFFHRMHPRLRAARSAIAAGRIGLPWNVQADFFVAGGRAVPEGEIANFAAFPIDIVRYLVGLPIRDVFARANPCFTNPGDPHADGGTVQRGARPGMPVAAEDLAILMCDHDHGLRSTIVVGRRPGPEGGGERLFHRYRISGSHGTMEVDLAAPTMQLHGRTGELTDPARPDMVAALLDEVAAAVSGRQAEITARDGAATAAVLDASHASLSTGEPATVAGTEQAEAQQ